LLTSFDDKLLDADHQNCLKNHQLQLSTVSAFGFFLFFNKTREFQTQGRYLNQNTIAKAYQLNFDCFQRAHPQNI
jgi:hypothetical protein